MAPPLLNQLPASGSSTRRRTPDLQCLAPETGHLHIARHKAPPRYRSLDARGRRLKPACEDDEVTWNHVEAQAQRSRKLQNQASERVASLSSRTKRKSPEPPVKRCTGITVSPRKNLDNLRPPLPARGSAWAELPTPARQRTQRCFSPAVSEVSREHTPAKQRNQRRSSPTEEEVNHEHAPSRQNYQRCASPCVAEINHEHASRAKDSQEHFRQETMREQELPPLHTTPREHLKRPSSRAHSAKRASSAGHRAAAPQRPFSAVLAECRFREAPGTRTESHLQQRLRKAHTLPVADGSQSHVQRDHGSQVEKVIEGRPVISAELSRWNSAFARFVHDGEIHKDHVKDALRFCGYEDLRDDIIHQVVNDLTWYNTLDRHEFLRFVCLYEASLYAHYHFEFRQFDRDGTGKIGPEDLRALLSKIGIVPRAIVLADLVAEVTRGGSMLVDYQGFEQVQKNLMQCDGFLKSELEEFHVVFQNFDRDHSGDMNIRELTSALTWLGLPLSGEKLPAICELGDEDRSGTINEREFVRCLRHVYQEEIRQIRRFLASGKSRERISHGCELDALLRRLGYTASPQAIVDALEESGLRYERVCGLDIDSVSFFDRIHSLEALRLNLDADQICLLLKTLRSRNGFTEAEMTNFNETFDHHSTKLGELHNIAIGKALRCLGHPLPLDVLWKLVAEVDVEGHRILDFTMFVKLIRKCRDRDRQLAAEAFCRLDQGTGILDCSQQDDAFRILDCLDDDGHPPTRTKEELAGLNLESFLDICSRFRVHRLKSLRKHEGFSHSELAELRDSFRKFDKNGDGVIGRRELARLIEFLFPERAHKAEFRPYLTNLLSEIDADNSQTVDWGEFICLMRKIRDHDAEHRVASEQMTILELNFSYAEVKDFRELFLAADTDGLCKLSVASIHAMISRSGVMDEKHSDMLKTFFDSVVKKGSCYADFPEFLQIMSKVIGAGWFSEKPKVRPKSATLHSSR